MKNKRQPEDKCGHTAGGSVLYLVGAAWRGRVGNLRFEPAVLPYVVKVEIVVQVVL